MISRQPSPPPRRRNDDVESGKRRDDIKITLPFNLGCVEASGRVVVVTMIAVMALLLALYHDWKASTEHVALIQRVEVMTCVLTLNEAERREFRTEGRYCGGHLRHSGFRDDSALATPTQTWRAQEISDR